MRQSSQDDGPQFHIQGIGPDVIVQSDCLAYACVHPDIPHYPDRGRVVAHAECVPSATVVGAMWPRDLWRPSCSRWAAYTDFRPLDEPAF